MDTKDDQQKTYFEQSDSPRWSFGEAGKQGSDRRAGSYSVEKIRQTYPNAYMPWGEEDDRLLWAAWNSFLQKPQGKQNDFVRELATRFGRQPSSITARILELLAKATGKNVDSSPLPQSTSIKQERQGEGKHKKECLALDFNPQFQKAFEVMENTQNHVFITGKAGSGKSTLLTYWREHTKKKVAVLAPTGVAALNVKGQTIHSFFHFKPSTTPDKVRKIRDKRAKLYEKLDAIVIDEVSMVRADLLDSVDRFMRIHGKNTSLPFGGAQMIFIGDLYQLSPVLTYQEKPFFQLRYKTPYFFDARAFEHIEMGLIELEKIYRQKDDDFIALLNAIRNNTVTEEHLASLNARCDPNFELEAGEGNDFFVYLTPRNREADEINFKQLEKLPSKLYRYKGETEGEFDTKSLPTDLELNLKEGAQVMMVNNDVGGRWVNGSVGRIVGIKERRDEYDTLLIKLSDGELVKVTPHTWELFRYTYDATSDTLGSQVIGRFTQYPLILAWALTIHKSQGKTFDKVVVDIGRGTFAHGQVYVALSRATSLEGLILKKPIAKKHIFMDWRVVKFITQYQYKLSEKNLSLEEKMRIIQDAIATKTKLEITYLKSNDEKSRRIIQPFTVGEMEYMGKTYLGVSAFDSKSSEERIFRVDRILEMKVYG